MIIPTDLTSPRPSKGKLGTSSFRTSKYLKLNHNTFALTIDLTNHETTAMTSIDQTNHEKKIRSTLDRTNHQKIVIRKENQPVKSSYNRKRVKVKEIKKHICFDEIVIVRPVLHINDYTNEECLKCWYPYKNKNQRKAELRDTLQLVRDGKFVECTRGLERLSNGGRSRDRRKNSIQDILEEQEAQRLRAKSNRCEHFVYDDVKLRMAYRPHSRAALQIAHAMAKVDEMVVSRKIGDPNPHNIKYKQKNKVFASFHSSRQSLLTQ
jgi:hypothetical protein